MLSYIATYTLLPVHFIINACTSVFSYYKHLFFDSFFWEVATYKVALSLIKLLRGVQGAELLFKVPFKVWNSLLTDFVANKFVHRGIVQTLLDKIMPKYFEPNLNLASGKVICQIHSEIH